MTFTDSFKHKLSAQENSRGIWQALHIDIPLLLALLMLIAYGLFILYSASNQSLYAVEQQAMRIGIALLVMIGFAQISPMTYQRWAPWLYLIGVVLLATVLVIGHIDKGAQRWLNLGFVRVQPSELMKLAIPMYLACHFHKMHLPLTTRSVFFAALVILVPAVLTAKQPDLGTGILLAAAGASVLLLAGLRWKLVATITALIALGTPILWYAMHDYQRHVYHLLKS